MVLALTSVLLLGLLLGMRHATDPDHVVAVTTIVSHQRSVGRAAWVGVLWGIGHTTTIFIAGALIIGLRLQLTAIPPRIGLALEFAVALMLVVLGILALSGRAERVAHSHRRPLAVGFVHGLAGSAAVLALPQVALIPNPAWAVGYLLVFGLGTIAGMMAITAAIAVPTVYSTHRFASMQRYLRVASGVASIAFGLFLAHQIGVVDGLFTANPRWTPH